MSFLNCFFSEVPALSDDEKGSHLRLSRHEPFLVFRHLMMATRFPNLARSLRRTLSS